MPTTDRNLLRAAYLIMLFGIMCSTVAAQQKNTKPRSISPDLFGIFFEDISYAADGGLYAELIQNRSFEYNPSASRWNPFTAWEFAAKGYSYGTVSVETSAPIHPNNPHYVVLNVEEAAQEGLALMNHGFDGIPVKGGEEYNFSVFIRQLSGNSIPFEVQLRTKKGERIGVTSFSSTSNDWQKYTATITATQSNDTASLVLLAKAKGKFAVDVVSLFPKKTFKNRPNGMRADLAAVIADLKPKFVRFPGGCLVHGDGLGNMYRWKNTIGPIEQRIEQRNIWNYNQTMGLGYFEYFQFCEDIGAKPVPVVPAAVSCQNSGGTWRIGGTGQKGLPLEEMQEYIQEVVDLIEYANGPVTSVWGAKRAAAGHPQPFNLEYLGIGNEDKITPEFRERFKLIYDVVKAKHPEITLIGTVGPFHSGEDFEQGWKFAHQLAVPVVDEHYYEKPEWFLNNLKRYDTYDRSASKVYVGEYAAHDVKRESTLRSALAEAAYMTMLERNGDVVRMASYAPLLARKDHVSWSPDLIYFTGTTILPTVNYYVQQLFSVNQGDLYYSGIVTGDPNDSTLAASCVKDSKSGDVILKIVNAGSNSSPVKIDLSGFGSINSKAVLKVLRGKPDEKNTFQDPSTLVPVTSDMIVKKITTYAVPPYSLSVIRIRSKK
jgi:alpha-N-arabinofuranosidase